MANENLIRLIEQTPDIKKRFKTEYISFGKPAGKPAIQTPYRKRKISVAALQPPIFKLFGFLPEVFLTKAVELPKRNHLCHPCGSEFLPRDTVHNQKVLGYSLLKFRQYYK